MSINFKLIILQQNVLGYLSEWRQAVQNQNIKINLNEMLKILIVCACVSVISLHYGKDLTFSRIYR